MGTTSRLAHVTRRMSTAQPESREPSTWQRLGRGLEVGLTTYSNAIFGILWVGFFVGLASGGQLFDDAWAWLSGLDPLPAIVAWILILPMGVGLWAWQADLEPILTGFVLVGLILWTLASLSGLRVFRRR